MDTPQSSPFESEVSGLVDLRCTAKVAYECMQFVRGFEPLRISLQGEETEGGGQCNRAWSNSDVLKFKIHACCYPCIRLLNEDGPFTSFHQTPSWCESFRSFPTHLAMTFIPSCLVPTPPPTSKPLVHALFLIMLHSWTVFPSSTTLFPVPPSTTPIRISQARPAPPSSLTTQSNPTRKSRADSADRRPAPAHPAPCTRC